MSIKPASYGTTSSSSKPFPTSVYQNHQLSSYSSGSTRPTRRPRSPTMCTVPHNMPYDWTEGEQPIRSEYLRPCEEIQFNVSRLISGLYRLQSVPTQQVTPAIRTSNLNGHAASFIPSGNQQTSGLENTSSNSNMATSMPSQHSMQVAPPTTSTSIPRPYHTSPNIPSRYDPNLRITKDRLGGGRLEELPVISTNLHRKDPLFFVFQRDQTRMIDKCHDILKHYGQDHWARIELCGRIPKRDASTFPKAFPTPTILITMALDHNDQRQYRVLLDILIQVHHIWRYPRVGVEIIDPSFANEAAE